MTDRSGYVSRVERDESGVPRRLVWTRAEREARPMTDSTRALIQTVRAFAEGQLAKCVKSASSRRESAEEWRAMTQELAKEAAALATRMSGHKHSPGTPAEWRRNADCAEACARLDDDRAEQYRNVLALCEALEKSDD